ncbi:hypothetical protein HK414_22925 [Ramlibacter terrae]|uniref:Uncharacterized protein n=1 Tax=Ramlibacter terrae TaxID=2732511 RepID=A0ABX6P6T3_9BURK|nr:hypothetical protein HK414_22925 [Ramlibacter terrae]
MPVPVDALQHRALGAGRGLEVAPLQLAVGGLGRKALVAVARLHRDADRHALLLRPCRDGQRRRRLEVVGDVDHRAGEQRAHRGAADLPRQRRDFVAQCIAAEAEAGGQQAGAFAHGVFDGDADGFIGRQPAHDIEARSERGARERVDLVGAVLHVREVGLGRAQPAVHHLVDHADRLQVDHRWWRIEGASRRISA